MLILTLRTDKPESEIGLFEDGNQIAYETWQAHRQLAETIHSKIESTLKANNKEWSDINGVVAYQGPGSFTGLRIGLSVANAIANSYQIQIIGTTGDDWKQTGIAKLIKSEGATSIVPEYGAPVHITPPKK